MLFFILPPQWAGDDWLWLELGCQWPPHALLHGPAYKGESRITHTHTHIHTHTKMKPNKLLWHASQRWPWHAAVLMCSPHAAHPPPLPWHAVTAHNSPWSENHTRYCFQVYRLQSWKQKCVCMRGVCMFYMCTCVCVHVLHVCAFAFAHVCLCVWLIWVWERAGWKVERGGA